VNAAALLTYLLEQAAYRDYNPYALDSSPDAEDKSYTYRRGSQPSQRQATTLCGACN